MSRFQVKTTAFTKLQMSDKIVVSPLYRNNIVDIQHLKSATLDGINVVRVSRHGEHSPCGSRCSDEASRYTRHKTRRSSSLQHWNDQIIFLYFTYIYIYINVKSPWLLLVAGFLSASIGSLWLIIRRLCLLVRPAVTCLTTWGSSAHRVNLALAYTELTEELGRLRALSSKQTEILRKASQEQASPG